MCISRILTTLTVNTEQFRQCQVDGFQEKSSIIYLYSMDLKTTSQYFKPLFNLIICQYSTVYGSIKH